MSHSIASQYPTSALTSSQTRDDTALIETEKVKPGYAVISTFDLFSIRVTPSSSHTVGTMHIGKIFIMLEKKVKTVEIFLRVLERDFFLLQADSGGLHDSYGSLAATGKYLVMSPLAILLEGGLHLIGTAQRHDDSPSAALLDKELALDALSGLGALPMLDL
ncbi:uncharacterized protein F5147DRAFT_819888 [Suillus discolor]|uniref:Serine dehydratase beta chain domain-containing protein n=1 Tax=Suillus discolor TaxID=1912936 RepID=A0A9P7JPE5_9AGAM|nr:uncharacterized protein F5147DRAFT_819888 [Suillus discolor]KAG2094661.1 hypothetical protein F5147DRAFT_819888 [Suillus discolor]